MSDPSNLSAQPWREIELTLTAAQEYANAYTDVEVWADFTHDDGALLQGLAQRIQRAL